MHHTAGRGDPASVVNFWQKQGKGYGAQYIMDRNGVVHDTQKEFGYSGSNEILNGAGQYKNLNNHNVVGMEIVANDDSDVTDAQKQAAAKFIQASYPNTPVYGHGQINPGHKEATEGIGAVNAVLASRGQPLVQPDSATASAGPSRPASPTPGVTLNTSPLDLVANLESGNTNIKQGIVDANTARGTPAGGYFQIIDPTWRSHAAAAGVDVNQYPTAMSAPRDIQAKVASVIPINQWGANTVNALKAKFPGVDTSQTLGALQSTVLNGGSGAPGPIDPSIVAHGGTSPPIPSTPGTTINSTPATAGIGGQLGQLSKDPNVKKMLGLPDDDAQGQQPEVKPSPMIGPAPQARNVSTLLGGPGGIGQGQVSPAYAQRMDALNQPMTWGSAPPGQMPGTGYGVQAQPTVYGTSLMSNLGRSLDPMWMNSWGT